MNIEFVLFIRSVFFCFIIYAGCFEPELKIFSFSKGDKWAKFWHEYKLYHRLIHTICSKHELSKYVKLAKIKRASFIYKNEKENSPKNDYQKDSDCESSAECKN